ncbi:hypothetical protein [Streptomyces virginiae]|uniref:hypothetical protein n=1 Tax=Streptomyces virginiae TaxID=1961 RepID=UPI002E2C4251|nr:hypothetical protein [Streptomyces virginiae]
MRGTEHRVGAWSANGRGGGGAITHETYAHVMPDAPGRLRALMDSVFTRETELSLPLEFEAVVQAA